MRFDPLFDSFYVLSSLWGALAAPHVCSSRPHTLPAAALAAWVAVPHTSADVTAFVGVNVIPMDTERVLANQTVVVKNGWITALGPANTTPVPAGAEQIDGKGKYLMPGLTDMHAHLHMYVQVRGNDTDTGAVLRRKLFSYLAQGVTGVRYLGGDGKQWMRFRSPEFLAPRFYLAPSLAGIRTASLDSVASHVAAFKAAGYDFIEMSATYRNSENKDLVTRYDSVATAARRLGLTVASHTNSESFEDLLAFGAYGGSVEHLHYAFQDLLGPRETPVPDSVLRERAAAVRRAGTWISLTQDCIENRKKGDVETGRRLVKALHDAGVGLLLGADAETRPPTIVHVELANLVLAGLTSYQALATGTRNVAEYLGALDSTGTVAVGKRADLLLLYGNPLTDVRRLREPAGVMIAGRWLDRTTLDQGLLSSPRAWLQSTWAGFPNTRGVRLPNAAEQEKSRKVLQALADSLEMVAPPRTADSTDVSYERLLRRFTEELGASYPLWIPEQRAAFEPMARVWMRHQARQGRRLVIPGVTPVP